MDLRQPKEEAPQTLQSVLAKSSVREICGSLAPMEPDEIPQRITICARLLDAWPNARPTNRDRTLLEYVNATRGVPIAGLARCIQLAIDAGGDWMPAAGDVIRRAAVQASGGEPIGKDPDARYWHELRVSKTVERCRRLADLVLPISPEAITAGPAQLRLSDGRP